MGIVRANTSAWDDWKRGFAEHECYFCMKPGNGFPMVYWDGYSPDRGDAGGILTITMHARCARELGRHLIKDALIAQQEQRDQDADAFIEDSQRIIFKIEPDGAW